jgi:hypothetical protein
MRPDRPDASHQSAVENGAGDGVGVFHIDVRRVTAGLTSLRQGFGGPP